MGGIIVIFLVLSSLTPNQPISKKFSFKLVIVIMLLSTFFVYPLIKMNQVPSMTVLRSKAALGETTTFGIITFLILLYFIILSALILEIETPLRSERCHTKKNFVNFLRKSGNNNYTKARAGDKDCQRIFMRPSLPLHYNILLEFWVHFRFMPNSPDLNRFILNISLHLLLRGKILFYCRDYTRSVIRMSSSVDPHKWGLRILPIHLPSFVPRNVLL